MKRPVRIGSVPYLNARPLIFGIAQGMGAGRIELTLDVPAVLARRMADGDLDLALLPTVELARIPGLVVVPGLSIASRGPAASVLLVTRKPVTEVRSVALDPESRTSNALVQVLFARLWGRAPDFVPGRQHLSDSLADNDAAVRIGDKALFDPTPEGTTAVDLGEAWTAWTRLPFVFAVWATRPEAFDRQIYETLHASRKEGSRVVDWIASDYTWNGRQHPERSLEYLTRRMVYRLGGEEVAGMRRFLSAARELGLVDLPAEIRLATFGEARCGPCDPAREVLAGEEA